MRVFAESRYDPTSGNDSDAQDLMSPCIVGSIGICLNKIERKVAEGVRFELTVESPLQRFSRPSPSTARPPLQKLLAHSSAPTQSISNEPSAMNNELLYQRALMIRNKTSRVRFTTIGKA